MLADNYDPKTPFKFAKLDINDGFWRMQVSRENAWNFCYLLLHTDPITTLDDTEIVVPNCLQMGWCEIHTTFFLRSIGNGPQHHQSPPTGGTIASTPIRRRDATRRNCFSIISSTSKGNINQPGGSFCRWLHGGYKQPQRGKFDALFSSHALWGALDFPTTRYIEASRRRPNFTKEIERRRGNVVHDKENPWLADQRRKLHIATNL